MEAHRFTRCKDLQEAGSLLKEQGHPSREKTGEIGLDVIQQARGQSHIRLKADLRPDGCAIGHGIAESHQG